MSREPSAPADPASGRFGRFEIRAHERRLYVDGQPVPLGNRAFDLLVTLVARRDRMVPKDELINLVWPGLVVEENNLQVQISALRKVLGVNAIVTVPGHGYQFAAAPVAATPAASPSPPPGAEHAAPDPRRVSRLLVVDDNKVNRLMLSRALQLLGHDVVTADNGRTALEKLRSERFDLLLLDLKMPEMDGFDLLELRAEEPSMHDVPVIVTSAVEGVAEVARCIELGADDFLRKPVNPVLLRARVDSSLERKFLRDRQRASLKRLDEAVSDAPEVKVEGRSEDATLLVASLAGYVAAAEAPSVGAILELLGTWTTLMLDAVESRGGRVQHINGDGLMALFGSSRGSAEPHEPAVAAVRAAEEMIALTAQLDHERNVATKSPAALGIGIASGRVVTGYAGTPLRLARVCVGTATQRATQLAGWSTTQRLGPLLDEATRAAIAGRIETRALESAEGRPHLDARLAYTLAR